MVVGCPTPTLTPTPTPTPMRDSEVSETLIVEIDFSSWIPGSLIISPDNRRVAYVAVVGNKVLVVVDGVEGKQYDAIGAKIIFDAPNSLHYLALKDNSVYLVEERIR